MAVSGEIRQQAAVVAPLARERGGRRRVTVLGSTGSVGCNTVDLLERNRERYAVEALVAGANVELLARQARSLAPRLVVVADEARYRALKAAVGGLRIEVAAGAEAVVAAAERPAEWVMSAIVGAAGLAPTLAALRRGATVALANKECLVCAGTLLTAEVSHHGATLLPVDSEHSAIFQVFDAGRREAVEKLILTASGGPFRERPAADLARVTPAEAVAHPNWAMGAKISVDSATMMNKGLELIEAHHLFAMPESRIDVLVHPQSVVHSLVAYVDGSVLAQLGSPDMRTPIAYALAWPERMATPAARLDLAAIARLTFEAPDLARFPALRVAREALRAGGGAPTVLNAANEAAVQGFLDGRLAFTDIVAVVEEALATVPAPAPTGVHEAIALDAEARRQSAELICRLAGRSPMVARAARGETA